MKRVVLEWCLIFSVGITLVIAGLWVDTKFVDATAHHLRFPTTGLVQDDLHLLARDGDFAACNQFHIDETSKPRPLIVNPQRLSRADWLRGERARSLSFPGFAFHYYHSTVNDYVVWSLQLSLLYLVAIAFLLSVAVRVLVKRHQARGVRAVSDGRATEESIAR